MAESVIRQDVVEISFKTDLSGLTAATKGLDDLKKSVLGINTDDSLKKLADSTKGVKTGVDSVTSSISKMGQDTGITNVTNDTKKLTDSLLKTKSIKIADGITSDIKKFDTAIATTKTKVTDFTTKIKDVAKIKFDSLVSSAKNIGTAITHPIASIKTGFSNIQTSIASTANRLKDFAQIKISNVADSARNIKNAFTEGETGVKGFVTALGNIGKTAVVSGFNNIKNGLSSIKDGAKNGAKFLGEMGKTSFSLLKSSMNGVTSAVTKIATVAKDKALSALKTLGSAGASALSKLGDAAKGVASTIASAFDKAVKGIAVAATAITTAIGTISVKAISAYADQEQLIGGVETLFKDSAGELVNYANDAYKTAGMSANDYMDNVTGFSASLISSLGGDTKKAVETANQAIVDMSDNSNKMGTDIGMIQNAYQGFAKQNYTINLMSAA